MWTTFAMRFGYLQYSTFSNRHRIHPFRRLSYPKLWSLVCHWCVTQSGWIPTARLMDPSLLLRFTQDWVREDNENHVTSGSCVLWEVVET